MIICADDFGITEGVSRAIIDLVNKQRLNAVSCLAVSPHSKLFINQLKERFSDIDIGLHFALTGTAFRSLAGKNNSTIATASGNFYTYSRLLKSSYKRTLNSKDIELELD
jgi:predicted glycoside hydrolase/deacetylase ChbG (UPF0249 family)